MPKKRRRGTPRHLPVRLETRANGRRTLEVGGVTQSVAVTEADVHPASGPALGPDGGYWGLLLSPHCPKHALLLGVGGGTVATLLARRCADTRITGVERDATVIAVARSEFGLDDLTRLTLVEADAFEWAARHAVTEPATYDLICVDLFEAGRLAAGTLATAFLRHLAALLAPQGTMSINLMLTGRTPEQLHRIRRVFEITREMRTGGNLVLHCRALEGDVG